jgi:hypothetical protein
MTRLTPRLVGHDPGSPAGLLRAHRVNTARLSVAKIPAALSRQGIWDRALDGSASKVTPSDHLGKELLAIVARLGLSLFLTAGFAAGLSLYTGMTLANPNMVRACEGVFLWALARISCTTSRSA